MDMLWLVACVVLVTEAVYCRLLTEPHPHTLTHSHICAHTHTHTVTHQPAHTHTQDGSQNEESLVNLASDYAERFGVESLGVYDALEDVWRHTNNKTEFATPSPAPKVSSRLHFVQLRFIE